jgi:hypothetical protein
MNQNMPLMAASALASSTYSAGDLTTAIGRPLGGLAAAVPANAIINHPIQAQQNGALKMAASRRLVQVIIADPNENVSLEDCILFKGEEKVTDATDQELFFELDIKDLLEKHNEKRIKIIDKKVKERTEYLEPAKVRDLKMVVVTVANL